jgi:hypothetical protein
MPIRLEDKNRKFKRLRHSAKEKAQLSRAGFQHVLSSNVSAIAEDGNDLVVRFHGGATYKYKGAGDLFRPMLKSSSKGSFVWRKLINPKVSFSKVGSVTFKDDAQFSDRDLMTVSEKPTKRPLIPSLMSKENLLKLGIIARPNIIESILATNAI